MVTGTLAPAPMPATDDRAFPPTLQAVAARLRAIDPRAYARTRNHLDGRVTRLSPYLTHGFADVPQVIGFLREAHAVRVEDKLVFELAWREYFHHLWDRLGEAIFADRRQPPGSGYRTTLPPDLRTAATGVPAVDQAVRALYATGYLHNHARMWLAAYIVHLRKVHWRAGADWMVGHLLDGDLASNHLSWQWVAGTLTGKPYLFNADNVARYAPDWASPGTVIDQSYAQLEAIARSGSDVGPEPGNAAQTEEPPLFAAPPGSLVAPAAQPLPDGRITLIHPWSLGDVAGPAIGVIVTDHHARWPWSLPRWRFVLARMREITHSIHVGSAAELASQLAGRDCTARDTRNPHYRELLQALGAQLTPAPRCFDNPVKPCRSFSQFWERVRKHPPF